MKPSPSRVMQMELVQKRLTSSAVQEKSNLFQETFSSHQGADAERVSWNAFPSASLLVT